MTKKVVEIRPPDGEPGSAVDIADALDAEIDTMWG
jgi:hypothetical protein